MFLTDSHMVLCRWPENFLLMSSIYCLSPEQNSMFQRNLSSQEGKLVTLSFPRGLPDVFMLPWFQKVLMSGKVSPPFFFKIV